MTKNHLKIDRSDDTFIDANLLMKKKKYEGLVVQLSSVVPMMMSNISDERIFYKREENGFLQDKILHDDTIEDMLDIKYSYDPTTNILDVLEFTCSTLPPTINERYYWSYKSPPPHISYQIKNLEYVKNRQYYLNQYR